MSEREPTLPNLFVIGAPKCGTTSLHLYLDQHPEIEMSAVKEPQLFAGPDYEPSRLAGYERLFTGGAPVRGESSAVYSQFPHWPHVAARIRDALPQPPRFIYLVGDPIDRAVAHYAQLVTDGKESRPISEALAGGNGGSVYVAASRYATQLRQYLEHFEPDRILVLDQRDLLDRREATLARAFEFLGVDPGFRSQRFAEQLNTRDVLRLETSLGRRVRATRPFAAVRRAPIPDPARRALRRLVSRPVARPELDPALRASLAESLREEMDWLRSFTGQDFAGWSV